MPGKDRSVTHGVADPPICEQCQHQELSFFDPSCSGCSDILSDSDTTIPAIFAIMRQWVPQVQKNLKIIIDEIRKRGCGINDRDCVTDMTLLHYACKSGAIGIGDMDTATSLVSDLISQGADVGLRSRWMDMLPIHYAAFFDSGSIIRLLLKANNSADIDARCSGFENGTVLHIATNNLCLDAAKCLLQHGANAFLRDDKNRTPLNCVPEADDLFGKEAIVIANKLRRLLSEAETSGSESGVESVSESTANLLDVLGLKLGEKVLIGENKIGTLRYCGTTMFAKGHWVGIELEEAVGKNDGSVKGHVYFHCKPNYGIFCPVSKVSKLQVKSTNKSCLQRPSSARNTSVVKPRVSQQSKSRTVNSGSAPSSHSNSRSSSPQDSQENIEVGTRVVICGQENKKGIARFVGETKFAQGIWVGVELDDENGKNNGTVNDVKYFECQPNHGLFLHPSKLIREDCVQNNQRRRLSSSDEILNKPSSVSSVQSESNHDDQKTILKPLSQRLSNSVPDLSNRSEKRSQSKGIPRLKHSTVRKDQEVKQILKVGNNVYVNNEIAVLRFIGKTSFGEGLWLGVELSQPVGKNDGTVNGQQYFTCKQNHGLFVRPNKATQHGINCSKLVSLSS